MKIAATAILALAGAATVVATDYPPNMPECGKKCANDMFGKAAELGCGQGDIACLCKNVNFGYGVRDCSNAVCGNADEANVAIAWHNNLCSSAGVATTDLPSSETGLTGTAMPTGSPATITGGPAISTWTSVFTSGSVTTTLTGETTISGSSGETISTWTSVFTSGSVTTTLTGETTISGSSGATEATSNSETAVTSPIVSTRTEGGSTFVTTVGTSTRASGQASSSTSSGQGAQITAGPALGVLAAAGIAAAFL